MNVGLERLGVVEVPWAPSSGGEGKYSYQSLLLELMPSSFLPFSLRNSELVSTGAHCVTEKCLVLVLLRSNPVTAFWHKITGNSLGLFLLFWCLLLQELK